MSGGSSANSSWTILTPEETAAETLRALAEEHHEESLISAAGSGEKQSANSEESAESLPVEGHLVSEEKTAELSGDTSTKQHTSVPTTVTDDPVPTSLEVSGSFVPGSDALSQSEGLPEGPAQSSPDPDSFSDSYTHMTPSSDEPSLLSTETLGGGEFTQEEERLEQEGTLHPLNGEELLQEWEGSDLFPRTTDLGKQADSLVDSEVVEGTPEMTGEEAEPEVRRRHSLLAALERIGRTEEEEEGEEEFQLPKQEGNSGFSVNKCILGAVILLGLGTIFFSDSDYGTMELKDAETPGKQEWLNPEVPPLPVDDGTELLNKLAKGNQQISVLQAQLQAQKEELKVVKGQAAEGAKERLQREAVEKENSRLKKEMASLPVLQKENERMKRELESVPALKKDLETLRSTVTELKLSPGTKGEAPSEAAEAPVKPTTSPPSGQPEELAQDSGSKKTWHDHKEKRKDVKMDKMDMGEKKQWKERDTFEWKDGEKKEHKDGGKTEWKKGKHEHGKVDGEKHQEGKQKRHSDLKERDWKTEKASRGDEGKPWKDREGKKEWIEKSVGKERKEEKNWKKTKHEKVQEGLQSRGKEEKKDWKVEKDRGEKEEKRDWKKGKDYREKEEKKDWKVGKDRGEKEEKRDCKKGKDYREKEEKKDWKVGKDRGEKEEKRDCKKGKDYREKEEKKDWKVGKDSGEKHKSKEESKGEKEWKKGKDGFRESGKEKWEKKDWKEKGEKEWKKKEGDWRSINHGKEGKGKGERKQWEETKDHGADRKQRNENERKSKNGKEDKEWRNKDEKKRWEKKEEPWKRGGEKDKEHHGDRKHDRSGSQQHKQEYKFDGNHGHKEEHLWGDGKPPHTHSRPSLEQPEYWDQQRNRLQHNPKPAQQCDSLETCAQAEGLLPVSFPEFEAVLQTYLAKAEEAGVDDSKREELRKLASEFFKDGVFVHDQTSFQEFVEDLADILEDMVEEDDEDTEEEDSAIEEEMEGFEREVLKKFSVPGAVEREERSKGELRKETGQGRD